MDVSNLVRPNDRILILFMVLPCPTITSSMLPMPSMKKVDMTKNTLAVIFSVCAAAVGLSACGSSGSSSGGSASSLTLVAYSTPQAAFEKLIPAFGATPEGKGVSFKQSYGPSGEQSRAVSNGLHADVVDFSLEPDVERLVKAGLVSSPWNQNATHGFVTNSV